MWCDFFFRRECRDPETTFTKYYIFFHFTRSSLLTPSMSYFITNNDCKVVFYYLNRKCFFWQNWFRQRSALLIHSLAILNRVVLAGQEITSSTQTSFTTNVISHKTSVKDKQWKGSWYEMWGLPGGAELYIRRSLNLHFAHIMKSHCVELMTYFTY